MMEKTLSALFLLLSIIYVSYARELSFGTFTAPKAGFLPLISGVSAIVLSLAVLVRRELPAQGEQAETINWRKSMLIMAGLFAYLIGIKIAGYSIATFAVLLYWCKITDTAGWITPCFIAAAVAVLIKLLVEQYLGIPLP